MKALIGFLFGVSAGLLIMALVLSELRLGIFSDIWGGKYGTLLPILLSITVFLGIVAATITVVALIEKEE